MRTFIIVEWPVIVASRATPFAPSFANREWPLTASHPSPVSTGAATSGAAVAPTASRTRVCHAASKFTLELPRAGIDLVIVIRQNSGPVVLEVEILYESMILALPHPAGALNVAISKLSVAWPNKCPPRAISKHTANIIFFIDNGRKDHPGFSPTGSLKYFNQ